MSPGQRKQERGSAWTAQAVYAVVLVGLLWVGLQPLKRGAEAPSLPSLLPGILTMPAASGQALGATPSPKENLDLPYDAAGEASSEEEAPEILSFYGRGYEASAIVFALDESGSMSDQGRWQLQTREVMRSLRELSARSEFGVVYYGSRVSAFRKSPARAEEGPKAQALQFVNSRKPNGDTCIGEGVIEALKIVRQSKSKHRAVIVTSDGRPDVCATGDRATPEQVRQLLARTAAANPDGSVQVHTIFVGRGTEKEAIAFMRRLALQHNGMFRLLAN